MRNERRFLLVCLGLLTITILSARGWDKRLFAKFDKRSYLTQQQIAFVRPGLDLDVQEISVGEDRRVSVTFTVKDDRGLPLDLDGVFTPGPIRARFVLAYIPEDQDQYQAYTTRVQTSPLTGVSAVQPAADSGGTFEKIGDGLYVYTFGTLLPEGFDKDATHSVGIYSDRDLSEFGLSTAIDNDVVNFVPSGAEVTKVREVVATTDCNSCHDPLEHHGGFRQEASLCVMCHYDGVEDPDTGNSVDFRVMVHKIHRGADLHSVQEGTPYQLIGFRQNVEDFSTVEFPQDLRNCDTCHNPDHATQAEAYLLRPTRAACGSCHDEVNFETGEDHPGGPQASDQACTFCHVPEGELEFDASVVGAHTIPARSRELEGLNITIQDVMNTGPGDTPTVTFTLKTDQGETVLPWDLSFLNLTMAGPTEDYSFLARESAVDGAQPFGEGFSYTFDTPIPGDAEGTFAIGAEAFRNVELSGGQSVRETAENPVRYFPVTDDKAIPRRMLVSDTKCESCHQSLNAHGTIRHNATAYCQLCHQTSADDSGFRPEGEVPHSIDFKYLIHKIHMGEELTRDYTVVGFRGSLHEFAEVRFPGDQRNCMKCHVGDSYEIPSQGLLPTIAPREFFSPIAPNSAACLACHDTIETAAHAFTNIAPFAEACAACHGRQAEFAVAKSHAR